MGKKIVREAGVLMPVASLPSPYGIGCFSKEAFEFVDSLVAAGQRYWQILPLGPTGYGDSPYQSFSTYAGNPYFIDPQYLIDKGWISKAKCDSYDFGDNDEYIDYEKIYLSRFKMLKEAFLNSNISEDDDFKSFVKENDWWLQDYAMYMAIKVENNNLAWVDWEEDIVKREPKALEKCRVRLKTEIEFYRFQQYLFNVQWCKLKEYANNNGVKIIGDIPIYVAFDSADAWANPELFQFDENCLPVGVAGCPPDAFAVSGQLWGNPLYNWSYHKKTGYEWWMKRLSHVFSLYDVVRIDHFRGFDEYYAIPYGDPTAENGKWEPGPGYELFDTMKKKLGDKEVIAEDLGFLTPSVLKLVKKTGYPGMKILQFAFDSREESEYLPHNYTSNCVVYTGTHDNDTTVGWFNTQSRSNKKFIREYLSAQRGSAIKVCEAMVRAGLSSVAKLCIIPVQDYLVLGNEARINFPSTLGNNWKWRMKKGAFTEERCRQIARLTHVYGRNRE